MTKIAVTGGSGKAGRAVVRDLLEHGHDVLNIDPVPSARSPRGRNRLQVFAVERRDRTLALRPLTP